MRDRLRVLVVTDVPGDVGLIDDELMARGHQALIEKPDPDDDPGRILSETPYDAVLLDGGRDARSVADLIRRAAAAGVPVVLLLDADDPEAVFAALRTGVADCVARDRPHRLLPAIERGQRRGSDRERRRTAEQARDRLVLALERTAEAIAISDPDGRLVYVNRAFETMIGTSREELLGDGEALSSPGTEEVCRRIRAAVLSGRSWSGELGHERPDGSRVELRANVSPVGRDGEEPTHLVAVLRDVTEERRVQSQLLQSQKMEVLGRVAGGVAHDFNNFLTVVSGFAELLMANLADGDPLRRHAEEIARAGKKAGILARKLLTFSRKQDFEPRVIDLALLLADTERMLERLISENVVLETHHPTGPFLVEADPLQLEQVVMNLVVNARDAMPDGGRLSITFDRVDVNGLGRGVGLKPGRYVRLEVADNGCGMDEETRARVFEPFFTTKPQALGTGLGLSTVYGIVRRCGGHVDIHSQPDVGTSVRVFLPEVDRPARRSTPKTEMPPPGTRTGTVLVVEDEAAVRGVVRRTLERVGYRVLEAADSAEAQQVILRGKTVDVLVCDVVLPGLPGPEVARFVRRRHPEVRVVFMSGYPESLPASEKDAVFLRKPFPPSLIAREVDRLMASGEAQGA